MIIRPARRVCGTVTLPGDKSISHRAAILAALAHGVTEISNFSTGADCASTLSCLRQLGVVMEQDGTTWRVNGRGRAGLQAPAASLDCGNSGSTMRLLAGVLAACPFPSRLTGDKSLSARPMQRIIKPLEMMGARLTATAGHAPLHIQGTDRLQPVAYDMPVASAQVKSCILLAGLGTRGPTSVTEHGAPTRDHTERMLRWLGVKVESQSEDGALRLAVTGPAQWAARNLRVPGDISSAAFFLAAAVMLPDSEVVLPNIGLNPTRTKVLSVLRGLGGEIMTEDERAENNEPMGTLRVRGTGLLQGTNTLQAPLVATLIDELPMLAVLGTQIKGGLAIRDAGELRVKESDRIATTVSNLRAMGAQVEEYPDGLRVAGPVALRGAHLDSYGDHRIAMAFAVAALVAEGPSAISGAECAAVSFPEFFTLLESLAQR